MAASSMATAQPASKPTGTGQPWTHRHLLQLRGLSPAELRRVLALARVYRGRIGASPLSESGGKQGTELAGRVVANLFFEDSTRTRVSFSVAARRLGAEVIDLTSAGSSVSKGETVIDTAANVAAMGVDAVVIRHRSSGAPHMVVRALEQLHDAYSRTPERAPAFVGAGGGHGCTVVNAGDGRHEHPTQGLLDIYTVAEAFGRLDGFDLSGLTVGILGDIASSRVARSGVAGLTALGAKVVCIGPPTLAPLSLRSLGCEVRHDLDGVLESLDVLNVLRIQFERHEVGGGKAGGENKPAAVSSNAIASIREYAEFYALDAQRAARLKPGAIIMHPGPINRGVEITSDVADGERSVVLRQVSHGVAVRMAVLALCMGAVG